MRYAYYENFAQRRGVYVIGTPGGLQFCRTQKSCCRLVIVSRGGPPLPPPFVTPLILQSRFYGHGNTNIWTPFWEDSFLWLTGKFFGVVFPCLCKPFTTL